MNLIQQVRSDKPQVNLIWRFYSDPVHHWRWQRLTIDGTVVEHSSSAYSQYEACLANAGKHGYASLPSLSTKANRTSSKVGRSNTGLTTTHQALVSEIESEAAEHKEDIPIDDALNGD